ncbi:MAG: tRNA (N(6)-L-threonylcarbamoyladenosine(37)-C(2))-methylthiotransferase MtaB [Lachnospiraceae bacterium]|jgi:threonylcarbamoyladenosine tRNA methylthiotransferase MtaB|nr:tRNA (N(6)-L-threonylcarbamoyladenosine(37)-C(2))-methylthiotransferase MtaB [Lachnospiraceae bacterium]
MKKRAAFHNLGCKVNAYETEAMIQQLKGEGYEIVPFEEKADVYIINTCTVTNIADRKSRQMINRARKQNPQAVVVAAGCYVQARGGELLEDGTVDLIVGNNQKGRLAGLLERCLREKTDHPGRRDLPEETNLPEDLRGETAYEELGIAGTAGHTRVFLKVQDGCNQFCSYCIIPYVRGRIRSRGLEETQQEVRRLAEEGYREIVLTGIHLSSYGLDLGMGEKTQETPFGEGLVRLVGALAEIPGIERIRLGSLEPRIVTESFVDALVSCTKLCPHFHLSLQSGCDSVLKRMNRRYTTQEYRNKCRLLREGFEQPAITTDVITGFPGETEEEFAATKAFVEEMGFYEMHVFPYSRRRGTVADGMAGQVPESVKKERSHELLALAQEMSERFRQSYVGREADAVMEEPEGEGYMAGYTREYIRVRRAGGRELAGLRVHGKITCRNGIYVLE